MRRLSQALAALALFTAHLPAQEAEEPVLLVPMLRNGDFSQPLEPKVVPGAIPWWLQKERCGTLELDGKNWMVTRDEAVGHQPIPAYAPLVEGMVVRGTMRGTGRVAIVDGRGQRAVLDLGPVQETSFEWTGTEIAEAMGATPIPRLSFELSAREGKAAAWTDLEVLVPLPCPSEEALREEILELMHRILDPWLERSLDDLGPEQTGLVCAFFDAITGERLRVHEAGYHPLMRTLFDAIEHEPDPRWVETVEHYIENTLTLLIHPETHLPRMWNPRADEPLDDLEIEIHVYMRFLLDAAERGPEAYRARCLAAAERMAETILAHGVLPDGDVAASYHPGKGKGNNSTRGIRRFDVPVQLTRLAKLNGDERLLEVSRDAVATMLYTHYWPGDWRKIDPGFDDDFGHYGDRAATMSACFPEEKLFRRVVDSAWDKFRVVWPQAIRFGGSMAADQVRGWKILSEYSALRPDIREELDGILEEAVHCQLRGQQYGSGAWGDVTYYGFQPAVDLQVGDLPGTPSNLLQGIAAIYGTGLGPSDEELRAIFTAVLRSSEETYAREYGFLSGMREAAGANDAGGSLRLGPALTLMLEELSD